MCLRLDTVPESDVQTDRQTRDLLKQYCALQAWHADERYKFNTGLYHNMIEVQPAHTTYKIFNISYLYKKKSSYKPYSSRHSSLTFGSSSLSCKAAILKYKQTTALK